MFFYFFLSPSSVFALIHNIILIFFLSKVGVGCNLHNPLTPTPFSRSFVLKDSPKYFYIHITETSLYLCFMHLHAHVHLTRLENESWLNLRLKYTVKLSILTYAGIGIKSSWFELSHNTLCIQFLIFDKSFYKAFKRNTNIYKTIQRNFLKVGTERRKVGGVNHCIRMPL